MTSLLGYRLVRKKMGKKNNKVKKNVRKKKFSEKILGGKKNVCEKKFG